MVTFLVGAAIGVAIAAAAILGGCKVQTREEWEQEQLRTNTCRTAFWIEKAQNAKLRLALAAGEMTEDGKKVAAMTMAALNAVITADKERFEERESSPVAAQEPALTLEDKP